ncbi:MAG TPA: hypothetical protein VFG76_06510 [Candidatus Polarisedimenticolia bacterium]|nr:hypothetical protein [Candidatus Polarisedimenticolia bacterium]
MNRARLLVGLAVLGLGITGAQASTVIGLTVEDQARLAEMVVVGEVVSQRGVNHPVNGLETAVTLKVSEVLKGSARPGQAVVFHTRSGEVDGEISEAIGEAILHPGQKVLVFIEKVEGRRYNLGLSMGVWDVSEDRTGAMSFTRALQDGLTVVGDAAVEHGPVSLDDMRSKVAHAGRNPRFDNEILRAQPGRER